jgi:hypothetical protein
VFEIGAIYSFVFVFVIKGKGAIYEFLANSDGRTMDERSELLAKSALMAEVCRCCFKFMKLLAYLLQYVDFYKTFCIFS